MAGNTPRQGQAQPRLASASAQLFPGLEPFRITLDKAASGPLGWDGAAIEIAGVQSRATRGPPLLLLHGFPQNHTMWSKLLAAQPALAERFTLVIPDLRGYGASSKPATAPDFASPDGLAKADPKHALYSKTAFARDFFALMAALVGPDTPFYLLAHDRGARVAHRMLILDSERAPGSPGLIKKSILVDIAPTVSMFANTTDTTATAYWHWFFLAQAPPFPEQLILAAPDAFAAKQLVGLGGHPVVGPVAESRHKQLFGEAAYATYLEQMRDPACVHAMCEDYRAAVTADLDEAKPRAAAEHPSHAIAAPTRLVWGGRGLLGKQFDPVAEWQRFALPGAIDDKGSTALDCGHYIPEEKPAELASLVLDFFA